MLNKAGLADEISAAINGSVSGEVRVRWSTTNGKRVVEFVKVADWSDPNRSRTHLPDLAFGQLDLQVPDLGSDPLLPAAVQLHRRSLSENGSAISAELIRRALRVGAKRSRRLRDAVLTIHSVDQKEAV